MDFTYSALFGAGLSQTKIARLMGVTRQEVNKDLRYFVGSSIPLGEDPYVKVVPPPPPAGEAAFYYGGAYYERNETVETLAQMVRWLDEKLQRVLEAAEEVGKRDEVTANKFRRAVGSPYFD